MTGSLSAPVVGHKEGPAPVRAPVLVAGVQQVGVEEDGVTGLCLAVI